MMEGRIITGDHREFVLAAWDGANRSGYDPLDDKVLVLMDEHVEITAGGIAIPVQTVERQSAAGETGLVVALGPAAFVWNDEATREWRGRRPEPGDRVYIERYAGQLLQGADGKTYRLMSQRCVGAVANEAMAAMATTKVAKADKVANQLPASMPKRRSKRNG